MYSLKGFSACLMVATASALPQSTDQPEPMTSYFSLQVIAPGYDYDQQCAIAYHTGAGTNDLLLGECGPRTEQYYDYNGGIASIVFQDGSSAKPTGGIVLGSGSDYGSWYALSNTINGPSGGITYSVEEGYKQTNGAGFLACNWSHEGSPQLFNFVTPYNSSVYELPSSCAEVRLDRFNGMN